MKSNHSFPLRMAAVLTGAAVLERGLRIAYSAAATNVLSRETVWPTVLLYAAVFCSTLLLAMALAAVSDAAYDGKRVRALGMFVLSGGVMLLDTLSGWLIDLWQRNIAGLEWLALLNLLASLGGRLLLLAAGWILAWIFGKRSRRQAGEKETGWRAPARRFALWRAITLAAALFCLVQLGLVTKETVTFLLEVHYPTAAELGSIAGDVAYTLFFSGILLGGGSVLLLPLARHDAGKTTW